MFLLIIWRYSYVLLENILWTSKLILGKSIYLHYVLFTSFIWQNNLKVTEENKSISELFENKNYAPSCHSHHLSNDELLFINKTKQPLLGTIQFHRLCFSISLLSLFDPSLLRFSIPFPLLRNSISLRFDLLRLFNSGTIQTHFRMTLCLRSNKLTQVEFH